jgi:hypothetical protein
MISARRFTACPNGLGFYGKRCLLMEVRAAAEGEYACEEVSVAVSTENIVS